MADLTKLCAYDYALPPELIAQQPANPRDAARLLVVDRQRGTWEHRHVSDLPELLQPGDCLVVNDSRVVPARLIGHRAATGGKWEGLFLGRLPEGDWKLIGQTRGHLQAGESVAISPQSSDASPFELQLVERLEGGLWRARPRSAVDTWQLLDTYGSVPLPPYIQHGTAQPGDRERYQTVYANSPGSAAAPTAGLHLTPELLDRCASRQISRQHVTLHVGLGTFRPVNVEDVREHQMHAEWCCVPESTAIAVRDTHLAGRRVAAVGTTSLRTLESAAAAAAAAAAQADMGWEGESRLFIYPPYQFQTVDVLLTNFHLPKSSLLMLVAAFMGYDLMREVYDVAIHERYRFFSYGDAMLIL